MAQRSIEAKILKVVLPSGAEHYFDPTAHYRTSKILKGALKICIDRNWVVNRKEHGTDDLIERIADASCSCISQETGGKVIIKPFESIEWVDSDPNK